MVDQSSCSITGVAGGISTSPGGCTVSSNVVTLTNAFGTTGSFTKGSTAPLTFVFSIGGTNPITVADAGTFTVLTAALIGGNPFAIDSS